MNAHPCPLCSSSRTVVFLEQRNAPVHQNRVFRSEEAARNAARGDLTMTACANCEFVFNAMFDPGKLEYGENYENTQLCSPFFSDYVDGLVQRIVEGGARGKTIVEVGCGNGYFLRKLVEADPGNVGIGFDEAYEGPSSDLGGRVTFRRELYDGQSPAPDVIVCRHVIEHVPDPAAMLRSIRAGSSRSDVLVFFETPALEWILDNEVVWDFFYEHCSLFTANSLAHAFRAAGFTVDTVKRVFNDQYLWLEARPAPSEAVDTEPSPAIAERAVAFGHEIRDSIAQWRRRLEASPGKVAVWGAGAKGVTFVNLADPGRTLIECVVDLNPRKAGGFVAGTGHPIVSPADLRDRGIAQAILMNPNYETENRRIVAELGLDVELVSG